MENTNTTEVFFEQLAAKARAALEQQREQKTFPIEQRVVYALAALDGYRRPLEAVDAGLLLNAIYHSKIWINCASRDLKANAAGARDVERRYALAFASGGWQLTETGVRRLAEQFGLEAPTDLAAHRAQLDLPQLKPSYQV